MTKTTSIYVLGGGLGLIIVFSLLTFWNPLPASQLAPSQCKFENVTACYFNQAFYVVACTNEYKWGGNVSVQGIADWRVCNSSQIEWMSPLAPNYTGMLFAKQK